MKRRTFLILKGEVGPGKVGDVGVILNPSFEHKSGLQPNGHQIICFPCALIL
jgi:hypothetical protein